MMPHHLPIRPEGGTSFLQSGALIVNVVPESPAQKAGLSEGDVLVSLDGKALGAYIDLADMVAAYAPGTEVTLEVAEQTAMHGQANREVTVTLGEHPEVEGKAYLGIEYIPLPSAESEPGAGTFRFRWYDDDGPCGDCEEHDERGLPWGGRRFEFRWPHR
jgi:membrane-associated protease RseP (regulator of RpoE activity)